MTRINELDASASSSPSSTETVVATGSFEFVFTVVKQPARVIRFSAAVALVPASPEHDVKFEKASASLPF
jgi:hypothetical protein